MDFVLWAQLAVLAISVASAVISASFARRATSAATTRAVDELAETVERFARVARRDTMRRVRASALVPEGAAGDTSPPPELVSVASHPPSKEDLRRQLFSRRING